MNDEIIQSLIQILKNDYHNDLDLFLSDIKSKLKSHQKEELLKQEKPKNKNTLIQIADLTKSYKVGEHNIDALKGISLDIYEGEIVALVGTSGSGKSTLLNLIGGLDTPTQGTIKVNNLTLSYMNDVQLSLYRNNTIGFIFQFFNLQPYLNIQENVEIPLMFRGKDLEIRRKASLEAIKAVGLENRITHLPAQLSGGQMQRTAIARAIVNKPKIILADEPTGNLDRNTGIEIINLIKQINKEKNTTVIIVTHDNFVANQADRIIKLSDGKLI